MLRVGLTGGIGSGKSTAAAIFRELGCFVSNSDEVARAMMQPGQPVYRCIVQQFGPAVVLPDGTLDRAALARLAFAEGRLEELNGIVHPAVIAWQNHWLLQLAQQHLDGVGMVESALIFEAKHGGAPGTETPVEAVDPRPVANDGAPWRSRFDRIVLVTAPQETRIQRHVDRYIARADASSHTERAVAEADARARIRAQMPDAQKQTMADIVIANDGSLQDLRLRVTEVWRTLRQDASGVFR